jgi:hypothetical protein
LTSRKALQTGGELSVYTARVRLIQIRKQEAELEEKRARTILNKRLSQVQKDLKARGVIARKEQRAKNKQITEVDKAKQPIPDDLLVAVPDLSKNPLEGEMIKDIEHRWERERQECYLICLERLRILEKAVATFLSILTVGTI